jgi:hypothetical protein
MFVGCGYGDWSESAHSSPCVHTAPSVALLCSMCYLESPRAPVNNRLIYKTLQSLRNTCTRQRTTYFPIGKLQHCGNIFDGSAIAKKHCATEIPCFHVFLCLTFCNQNLIYLCDFHMHCNCSKCSRKVMKITNKKDIVARIVVRKLLLQMSATNRSIGRWQYFQC